MFDNSAVQYYYGCIDDGVHIEDRYAVIHGSSSKLKLSLFSARLPKKQCSAYLIILGRSLRESSSHAGA